MLILQIYNTSRKWVGTNSRRSNKCMPIALLQTKRTCIFTNIQFSYKNQNLNSDFQKEFPERICILTFDRILITALLKSSVYFPKISGQELSKPSKIAVLSCMKKLQLLLIVLTDTPSCSTQFQTIDPH